MNAPRHRQAAFRIVAAIVLAGACMCAVFPAAADAGPQRRHRSAAKPAVAKGAVQVAVSHVDLHATLLRAFEAFNAGDLVAADAGYLQVLDTDPRNADALHGRAAIALRLEQFDRAADHYLRAIDADPRDAIAQAGLASLHSPADPTATATRLKLLLASQPGQHTLHFALGNLHAAAGRWHEAHHNFRAAHGADPTQPDYLFNVAVSLDQLRQAPQAAQYYRQALAAADKRQPGFERAQAAARLRELE